VFSLLPRCQGLCGSQKKTSMLVSIVNRTLLGHLFALVPRERPAQLGRHLRELAGERHAHALCGATIRQVEKHDVQARALDQGPDRRAASFTKDQVAFPMAWDGAIRGLRRPVANHDHSPQPTNA
jgi:hypothetical protein